MAERNSIFHVRCFFINRHRVGNYWHTTLACVGTSGRAYKLHSKLWSLLALIPAVLVGLMDSPQTAFLILGLYILIQFIESNFITTAIQKKLINMPPALILIAQLFMGALTGAWGLILALPVVLIIIVLVQELYIKKRTDSSDESEVRTSSSK